jgi:hypothetical protein
VRIRDVSVVRCFAALAAVVIGAAAVPGSNLTGSTPGVLPIPQLGSVVVRCDARWRVRPIFVLPGPDAEDATVSAGRITARNFSSAGVINRSTSVSLPYGAYASATLIVHDATEARQITATAKATFVARPGECYVKHWSVQMSVSLF